MARADLVCEELERCGIEYLVWLPDSEVRTFYDRITASKIRLVQVSREDEAMGVYTGLWMGGRKNAAVLIQNAGLFTSLEALRGLVLSAQLPLLLIIGYKEYHAALEGKAGPASLGRLTEPILDTLGIKHYLLDSDEDVENIGRAYRETNATGRPVAVLVGKEYD